MPWRTLKEKREQMGLSIDDVAEKLKVSKKYLLLLESGELTGLPEPVFVKGYIRAYCRLLGIESDPFLEEFNEYLEERASSFHPKIENLPDVPKRPWLTKRLVVATLAGVVVVLLVGLVVSRVQKEKKLLKMESGVESELAMESTTKVDKIPTRRVEAGKEKKKLPRRGTMEESEGARSRKVEERVGGEKGKKTVASAEKSMKEVRKLDLVVEAKDLTWVLVSADDGEPRDVTLYPGDRIEVRADREIYMKVGNAAGVEVTLNGKSVSLKGGVGEVVEKKFSIGEGR